MSDDPRVAVIAKSVNGPIALIAAGLTAMGKRKDEMDTAFVKRVVAAYFLAAQMVESGAALKKASKQGAAK